MEVSNFNLYNEPIEFQWLVFFFNIFMYGGLIFSALHLLRLAVFDKAKLVISNLTILGITGIAVAINIYFRIYMEIWMFIFLFLGVAYLCWIWIDRKSLRWTNISMAIFFLFTLGMYNLFNTKLQTITFSFFSFNDIVEYVFEFKPYFEIYLPGQALSTTKILIDDTWLIRGSEPIHYRLYLFYYFMQSIAITFWLVIFFDVLKKHMFFYDKQVAKLKEYMFFYAPEDFKWSDFLKPCAREIFLKAKKEELRRLKAGELIKAIIPKPSKRKAVESENSNLNQEKNTKNVEKTVTIVKTNDSNQTNPIDKNIRNSNLKSNIKMHEGATDEEDDMEIKKMKEQLLQQARDLEEKAQELIKMAHQMGCEETSSEVTEQLRKVHGLHEDLISNPVFSSIKNIQQLRTFMEWHVFAVWDFMSLTKRLQIDLTCVKLPWLPPKNQSAAHLINEIVCGEETDKTPTTGVTASHFELYLEAMREIGADTTQIKRFIKLVEDGTPYKQALKQVNAPAAVIDFTTSTIETALNGTTAQVLGSFFYGRENVIPEMFDTLLKDWKIDKAKAPTFVFYLERHIELDSGEHGPAAQKMIDDLCPSEKDKLEVYKAAIEAVNARISLWNALNVEIKKLS